MSYTVIWRRALVNLLAAFYVDARQKGLDPTAITRAVAEIDARLKHDPLDAGESRIDQERVLVVLPLIVDYDVFEDEHVVLVEAVRYILPRSQR
jgi:hypothetical protein